MAGAGRVAAGRKEPGLIASLCDLSQRASLAAITMPVLVAGGWALTARGDETDGEIPQALFAFAMGTFVLVPMLALTGLVTAGMVAFTAAWGTPGRASWGRTSVLILLGLWAAATAAYYDAAVIPVITR